MKDTLRERAEKTCREVQDILGVSTGDHPGEIAEAIEQAIIRALVEERQHCADKALESCAKHTDKAHQISEEIRQVNSVLISNLSSMR
tara:strand:+ start:345 stop:608 length:264 start_codon:yes stop_codon:yes gene_type:complete